MTRSYQSIATALLLALFLAGCGQATGSVTPFGGSSSAASAAKTGIKSGSCPDAVTALRQPLIFGYKNGLFMLAPDGGTSTSLIVPPVNVRAYAPAWSPDGKTLAFAYAQPSSDPNLQWLQVSVICGLDRQTGQGRLLLKGATVNESVEDPAWTADGQGLFVTYHQPQLDSKGTYYGDSFAVATAPLGGHLAKLVPDAINPQLSPNGQHLAYIHVDPASNAVVLMTSGPDGQGGQPLTTPRSAFINIVNPHWSPDNTRILFSGSGGPTKAAVPQPTLPGLTERLFGIDRAFAHGYPADLWLIGADGQNVQRLTKQNMDDPRAAWSPDGKTVDYTAGGAGGVYRIDLDTKTSRQITKDGDYGGIAWAP